MSAFAPISIDEIASLEKPKYVTPEQHGPLRWYDRQMVCASRGCGSSTYCKVKNVPRCMMHALRELNDMLDELGVTE